MQGQERQVISTSTARSSSMNFANKSNTSNINNKEVISPNPSMATTSPTNGSTKICTGKSGHDRTNSSNSTPLPVANIYVDSTIPLTRSRTVPNGKVTLGQQQLHPHPQILETSPSRQPERCYNSSGINNTINHSEGMIPASDSNDWHQQQIISNSPSRQHQHFSQAFPDSQEQALFEQRLCEDIYGVAVRKINQNGKSNLRYVKCLYVDSSEILHSSSDDPSTTNLNGPQNFSSSRSVSSRHSRGSLGALSRFLSGGGNHSSAAGTPSDHDAHRSLLSSGSHHQIPTHNQSKNKTRVLVWGKKKDVVVPLDHFTAVRKGKVNERSRRNPCEASRILSLVTIDIHSEDRKNAVSLDIEAPTRLDRDKFATAFSRFLNVPLLEEGESMKTQQFTPRTPSTSFPHQQYSHHSFSQQQQQQLLPLNQGAGGGDSSRSIARSIARSIKSDLTAQSWKGDPHNNSIPDIALTATNSQTTNGNGGSVRSSSNKRQQQQNAPLPVVTARVGGAPLTNGIISSKPPRNNMRRSTPPPIHPGTNLTALQNNSNSNSSKHQPQQSTANGGSSRTGSEVDDPPLASLPSSTRSRGANCNNDNAHDTYLNTISSSAATKRGKMVLEIPMATKSKLVSKTCLNNQNPAVSTPTTTATGAHVNSSNTALHTPISTTLSTANAKNHYHNQGETAMSDMDDMDGSIVSSITGVGFDQDLVEELHLALERMRVELDESRAEASRAVKVAEQAIQSAENSNSKDWNNTVTHKAAEAAATAQKRSAEAMAKARIAEERLEMERKTSALRKKQIKEADQMVAHWQTRAVAAEVQRFAVAEALETERKRIREFVLQQQQEDLINQQPPNTFVSSELNTSAGNVGTTEEVDRLRSNLAMESARRRKLLDELQDLRGTIRVYCRLERASCHDSKHSATLEMVSNEILVLHQNSSQKGHKISDTNQSQLSFEFDGILSSDMSHEDVYAEFEAACASVVEGFKICVMTYGQVNSGKTQTMLGDIRLNAVDRSVSIENEGIHLQAMRQLFSILEQRRDRFQDIVTMNLVEVHDERLTDLLAGTKFGEEHGKVEESRKSKRQQQDLKPTGTAEEKQQHPMGANSVSSSRPKLEIKTNRDGETVVRGILSVTVASYQDVLRVWTESLTRRTRRLTEQDLVDHRAYELDSHVVASLKIISKNICSGVTTTGRMQFVDLASSEIVTNRPFGSIDGVSSSATSKRNSSSSPSPEQLREDWKFSNKSLNTFREVVLARNQYQRAVPYRNSTITHILSDSLEADTKVVVIACVNSRDEEPSTTACTLQFAQEMRKVVVGKATRHSTIAPVGTNISNIKPK